MLQHHGDVLADGCKTDFLLGRTTKTNAAGLRCIEPQQQLHQGTFAAATGADDRDLLARCNGQVQLVKHQVFTVAEVEPTYFDANGLTPGERVFAPGILRLVGTRQQLVDPRQRAARGVKGVLQVKQLFHRADHEPQVAEHGEHLADGQVGKQHGEHRRRTEDVDAELEQQATGTAGSVGFPLGMNGVVTHFLGTLAQAPEEKALAVAGPHFLDGIKGFGQGLGEARRAVVLKFLQVFDALAQLHRGIDHQRIEQQDQQRQLPVHPHQNGRSAQQRQHGHQEAAKGFADKLIQGIQVGDQVRGHCAAAQAFVFAKGYTLEPFDQAHTDAIDNVLGQPCKQPRLHNVEHQRAATQTQGHQQHQADIPGSLLPTQRQCVVHHVECGIAMAQQHFVNQQGQQQRDGHAAQGRQHGNAVGDPQGFLVAQGQAANFRPGQAICAFGGLGDVGLVIHRWLAPTSGQATATARTAAGSRWSTTPTGHDARPARSGNRQSPNPAPK